MIVGGRKFHTLLFLNGRCSNLAHLYLIFECRMRDDSLFYSPCSLSSGQKWGTCARVWYIQQRPQLGPCSRVGYMITHLIGWTGNTILPK